MNERQYLIENAYLTEKQADFVCNWIQVQEASWRDEIEKTKVRILVEAAKILQKNANDFFNSLPTGNVNMWDWVIICKDHYKALTEAIEQIKQLK